jgi:ribosomal protein S18 acetylase RimI-like enzyme
MAKPVTTANQQFIIRNIRLSDIPTLAIHNTEAFWENPVTKLINPRKDLHPDDVIRGYRESIRRLTFNPRNIGFVVCLASDPTTPLGFAHFKRLGNDRSALDFIRSRGAWTRLSFFLLSYFFWVYDSVVNYIQPNRAINKEAGKVFGEWNKDDNERYWKPYPERSSRWQALGIVVSPKWQGKGIGRMLVTEGLKQAQKDDLIMGLGSSPEGMHLYKKLGFKLLGDFTHRIGDDEGGGIMIWYPQGYSKKLS